MASRVEFDSEDNGNESVSCNMQGLIVIVYNAVVWAGLIHVCAAFKYVKWK